MLCVSDAISQSIVQALSKEEEEKKREEAYAQYRQGKTTGSKAKVRAKVENGKMGKDKRSLPANCPCERMFRQRDSLYKPAVNAVPKEAKPHSSQHAALATPQRSFYFDANRVGIISKGR